MGNEDRPGKSSFYIARWKRDKKNLHSQVSSFKIITVALINSCDVGVVIFRFVTGIISLSSSDNEMIHPSTFVCDLSTCLESGSYVQYASRKLLEFHIILYEIVKILVHGEVVLIYERRFIIYYLTRATTSCGSWPHYSQTSIFPYFEFPSIML